MKINPIIQLNSNKRRTLYSKVFLPATGEWFLDVDAVAATTEDDTAATVEEDAWW